ncbi:MarR family transcriptional regulator [Sphingobacterium shayense]|uniref:MarR family transcriptional regulator n=1 Tax=Sphingobacterium shayense TaxID=626343 RepID=UPI0015561668|nr:MarR family transcriptional regulator [Sphingobacterium shayense]NQD71987.1 MarR family transcriptional regulator [Sphingobacterium shayense]
MSELTENQQNVLRALHDGATSHEEITAKSGVAKGSVTGILNSLVKKTLVVKNNDGTYTAVTSPKPESVQDNNDQEQSETQPVDSQNIKIKILIPYLKSEAAGEELKYALRTWETYFKEQIDVVVVGDREDWFSPEIIHIPHEVYLVKEECNCPSPSMIRNPQADVTHKIFTAIASGIITGDFILTNDDIFLLGSTFVHDIQTLKAFGKLENMGKEGNLYNQNARRTAKALESINLPTHRYGTHTPMLLNAEKLLEIIEKYNALDNGYLLTSLYFNEVYPDARPIQVDGTIKDTILASVYRSDVEPQLLRSIFDKRKFINCNSKGWSSIEKNLLEIHPVPSRFEN